MAAVFALVFLFALASVSLLLKTMGGNLDVGSIMAAGTFLLLAIGVFGGTLKVVLASERDDEQRH